MDKIRDEELMAMFCSGNTGAFQILFEKYKDRIFRFIVSSYEHDQVKAEDYAQEIFLRIIKYRDKFNPAMVFSTWLYTVARNYCINQLRNRPKVILWSTEQESGVEYRANGKNAVEELEGNELRKIILDAIKELPENLRTVFVLREIDGLANSEVAEIMNIQEGNARTLLHRAKKKLQALITPLLEEDNG